MAFEFSTEAEQRIAELLKRYPSSRSVVMPALYIVQEEQGYVSDDGVNWVSEKINLAPAHVWEIATFYTMYRKKPVGKYHIQLCRTLSCAVCGSASIKKIIVERLGLKPGEISSDGTWSFEEVECLGSCGTAPMCQINDTYFENLNREKFLNLIDRIEAEKPNLSYSTIRDALGEGLQGSPKSEVVRDG